MMHGQENIILRTYVYMKLFSCFDATHSDTLSKHFKYTLYKGLIPSEPLPYNLTELVTHTSYCTIQYCHVVSHIRNNEYSEQLQSKT
jgi:hypothetical protein